MLKKNHPIQLLLVVLLFVLIPLTACEHIDTISEEDLKSSKYEGYKEASFYNSTYEAGGKMEITIQNAQKINYGDFMQSEFVVKVYKEGIARYIYQQDSKKVCVRKQGMWPYPSSVIDNNLTDDFLTLDVDLIYGAHSARGTVIRKMTGSENFTVYTTLEVPKEIIKYIVGYRKNVDISVNQNKIGEITPDNIDKKIFSEVYRDLRADAEKYRTSFTNENLELAHILYQNMGEPANAAKVAKLQKLVGQFSAFYWSDNEKLENPGAKKKVGVVIGDCEIPYWNAKKQFLFKEHSTLLNDNPVAIAEVDGENILALQQVELPDLNKTDVVGVMELNGAVVNNGSAYLEDYWIAEYAGKVKVTIQDRDYELPKFKLLMEIN